jgi:hypothetical protein
MLNNLAGVLSTQISTPVLTGGTLTSDATYYYRTFTSNGDLGISGGAIACDILVVGAGASGAPYGGGGGAGGYRSLTSQSLSPATYPVVIGQGGASVPASPTTAAGNSGTASSINSNSAAGGGYGGAGLNNSFNLGGSGGSGGGGGSPASTGDGAGGTGNTPSTSPSQGNNGGTGRYLVGNYILGGGGGGAGGTGGNYSTGPNKGGTPGAGLTNSTYSTSSITYAVGGRGTEDRASSPTPTANTGTAGDSGYWNGSTQIGGTAGAAGVVVIKYLKSAV